MPKHRDEATGDDDLISALKAHGAINGMSDAEKSELITLAKGSVRKAIILSRSKAVDYFKDFIQSAKALSGDNSVIHRLASTLSTVKMADEYNLFLDLIFDHLSEQLRQPEFANAVEKQSALIDIWDETQNHIDRVEEWNMDKKQVILTLFQKIRTL